MQLACGGLSVPLTFTVPVRLGLVEVPFGVASSRPRYQKLKKGRRYKEVTTNGTDQPNGLNLYRAAG